MKSTSLEVSEFYLRELSYAANFKTVETSGVLFTKARAVIL